MLSLNFDRLRTILCLGAHADDLEIGCGGTLLQWLAARNDIEIHWVVFSAAGPRAAEAQASAEQLLQRARSKQIVLHQFRDTCFPFVGLDLKERFINLQRNISPDLILTHRRDDLHQDHRTISELTWNAFRDHLILEYEIPKYDGDLSTPNVFIPLTTAIAKQKIDHLMRHFQSQHSKPWYTSSTFEALLRIRGLECNSPSSLAEGFHCRKMVLQQST